MKVDFLNKEFVKSYFIDNHNYFYSHQSEKGFDERDAVEKYVPDSVVSGKQYGFLETEVISQGRTFIKTGKFCVQTMVGNIYKAEDERTKQTRYILQIGIAKQSPTDLIHDKKVAIEAGQEQAMTEPVMTILLDHRPGFYEFRDYVKPYLLNGKQKFVMTAEEKQVYEMKHNCPAHFINKD